MSEEQEKSLRGTVIIRLVACLLILAVSFAGFRFLKSRKKIPAQAEQVERPLKVEAVSAVFVEVPVVIEAHGELRSIRREDIAAEVAGVVVDFAGDTDIFVALGKYFATVLVGLFLMITILYPIYLKIFTKGIPLKRFFRALLPAQMVAFSTSSSAAALPVTMKQNTQELGVSEEIANFVLPVGVTINMDATAFYQAVAAVFIAQVYGIDLSFGQQLMIVLTATLSSIGSPGVPGGSIVLVIMVLTSVGLPVEGLALILGVDRPLDMLRSSVNLTGDSTISCIVAHSENELNLPEDYKKK